MKHCRLLLTFLTLILISVSSLSSTAKFDVHVIYFKPTDAPDIDHAYHDTIMKDIQQYFQSEMTRHGFTDKTFPLELDEDDKLIIHIINGKHNGEHYFRDTMAIMFEQTIKPELPFRFNNNINVESRDNVHLIVVGGVRIEELGTKGAGHTWKNGRWGGNALVNMTQKEKSPPHYLGLVAHELGHAFALDPGHNNVPESFNGRVIAWGHTTAEWGDKMQLLDFEAALLDSRPIFRKIVTPEPTPKPNAKFDVHVIYFKPTDAPDIDHEYHDKIMKDIQKYFQSEMTRHGFTDQTFPLELNRDDGKLRIHTVNAEHDTKRYTVLGDDIRTVYRNFIESELPFEFSNQKNIESRDNVHLIVVGGIKINGRWGGNRLSHTWHAGRWGGNAIIYEDIVTDWPNHYIGVVAHELGHAFALDPGHNNVAESLNGTVIAWGRTTAEWGGRMRLLKEEAVLLDSRPIFRKINLQEDTPKPNKNEDLELGEDDSDKDKGDPKFVNPRKKLTITWGELKKRR